MFHVERSIKPPCRVRRYVLLACVLPASCAWAGLGAYLFGPTMLAAAEPKAATVRLVVDYGDGVETHFKALKWRDGMTALDALAAARAHAHGVSYVLRGAGGTALITQIGDLKNEGTGRNWIYYVNDKSGEASAGVQQIKPGDAVLWKFETYRYNE